MGVRILGTRGMMGDLFVVGANLTLAALVIVGIYLVILNKGIGTISAGISQDENRMRGNFNELTNQINGAIITASNTGGYATARDTSLFIKEGFIIIGFDKTVIGPQDGCDGERGFSKPAACKTNACICICDVKDGCRTKATCTPVDPIIGRIVATPDVPSNYGQSSITVRGTAMNDVVFYGDCDDTRFSTQLLTIEARTTTETGVVVLGKVSPQAPTTPEETQTIT